MGAGIAHLARRVSENVVRAFDVYRGIKDIDEPGVRAKSVP